jgi:tRNA G18 (ribose-2'-O)-methylase SpoU
MDKRPKATAFHVLLDNIRSTWNVGSIFRTADGLGADKLYLCGITPTPANESVRKTSLGAEETLAWEYFRDAHKLAMDLKMEGYRLIGLEQDVRSDSLEKRPLIGSHLPVLVLGNEVTGVDPDLLDLCDQIIQIPMFGQKNSFNVEVAFGIAAYQLLYGKR